MDPECAAKASGATEQEDAPAPCPCGERPATIGGYCDECRADGTGDAVIGETRSIVVPIMRFVFDVSEMDGDGGYRGHLVRVDVRATATWATPGWSDLRVMDIDTGAPLALDDIDAGYRAQIWSQFEWAIVIRTMAQYESGAP